MYNFNVEVVYLNKVTNLQLKAEDIAEAFHKARIRLFDIYKKDVMAKAVEIVIRVTPLQLS